MTLIPYLKKLSNHPLIVKRKFFLLLLLVVFSTMTYPFTPMHVTESNATLEINSGSNLNQITNQLVEMNILKDSFRFKVLAFVTGNQTKLKKGYYKIPDSITPLGLLSILVDGKEMLFPITLVEGSTFKQIVELIDNNANIKKTIVGFDEQKILQLMRAEEPYVEGLFFPDTYYFYKNTTDLEILTNAYKVMKSKMQFLWENRTEDLPYESPYEAIIVASIIEKELGVEYEAPEIAGVFVNRLRANMRLQSDPTVIYGMQESFKGNIRKRDLRADTSHNTYTRKGIPPSPISLPSLISLEAALNPATTGYFYFVAKGNRMHHFSKTLKEHNRAVNTYQRRK